MTGLFVSAAISPQARDLAGRFAKASEVVDQELVRAAQQWAAEALPRLREATPVRSGAARQSWRLDWKPTKREAVVSNRKPYVPFLITGTREHDIPGAFGLQPPFGIGGRFGGRFHPGTQPNRLLVQAVERLKVTAKEELEQAGVRVVQRLVG